MKAELVEYWGTDLTPVNAARVSFDKESEWETDLSKARVLEDEHGEYWDYTLKEKDEKLIYYLAKHQHTSCFEHQGATLRLKVPIFIARQIQRHRTFSYNEISRRYVDTEPEFYWPDKWRKRADNVKQGSSDEEVPIPRMAVSRWADSPGLCNPREVIELVTMMYNTMLEDGVAPEQARMILPQNMYTEFYMTGNLRSWSHFLKLRLDAGAQKEVRDIAEQVEELLQPLWPVSMKALMRNHNA